MANRIRITTPFRGKRQVFEAGVYDVPQDMASAEARIAVIDGNGRWEAQPKRRPARARSKPPGRKGPAPENKLGAAAEENKGLGLDEGGRGSDGAEPEPGNGGADPAEPASGDRGQ